MPPQRYASTENVASTAAFIGGGVGVAALALLALVLAARRPNTRAYLQAAFGKAPELADGLQSIVVDQQITVEQVHQNQSCRSPPLARPGDTRVLLDSTARWRAGLSWWRPVHVQLLAAPVHSVDTPDAKPDAKGPSWSALVVDGVAVPYEEVRTVWMDENALEFRVECTDVAQHGKDHTAHADVHADAPRQHLRMYTRSDFNLWREALHPKITNPQLSTPPDTPPAGSTPSVVQAAQRWLAYAEQPQL